MKPVRAAVLLGAFLLAFCSSSFVSASAADPGAEDWFDRTLPSTATEISDPNVIATRRSTFDAFTAVHELVAPGDWKKAQTGNRVVVEPALRTFGLRLVDCTRVDVVVEELALTAPAGGNATAKHPNVEVLARIGAEDAVEASVGFVFIAEKGTGYHLTGGVNSGPASWDLEITHLSGNSYRLDQPTRDGGAPDRRAVGQDRCSTRAELPNTGLGAPRVLGPIGLALVVLGSALVRASRKPEGS